MINQLICNNPTFRPSNVDAKYIHGIHVPITQAQKRKKVEVKMKMKELNKKRTHHNLTIEQ